MRKLKLPGRTKNMPRLNEHDYRLIKDNGIREIKKQAREIVEAKLQEVPENDGTQTPKAGNPIYKAMHACHSASRRGLSLTHRVPQERDMTESEVQAVVNLLTRWIAREYNFYREEEDRQRDLGEFN